MQSTSQWDGYRWAIKAARWIENKTFTAKSQCSRGLVAIIVHHSYEDLGYHLPVEQYEKSSDDLKKANKDFIDDLGDLLEMRRYGVTAFTKRPYEKRLEDTKKKIEKELKETMF